MSLYAKFQAEKGTTAVPTSGATPPQNSGGGLYTQFQSGKLAPAPITKQQPIQEEEDGIFDKYSKGVNRLLGNVASGALESGGQFLRAIQWGSDRVVGKKIGKDIDTTEGFAYSAQDKTKEWGEVLKKSVGITPENTTLSDKLAQGFGSSAIYFVPGLGIARGSTVLATVSPKIAAFLGGSASAGLESMAEAGQVYDEVKKTQGAAKANDEASKTFMANALLLTITNQLGIFNPATKGLIKKALFSAPVEGVQESFQQMIQNKATGRPIGEGVIESGFIGAIVGGVMGGASELSSADVGANIPPTQGGGLYEKFQQTAQSAVTSAKTIAEAIKQVESGGDYKAKGTSGENGAYQFMPATWSGWAKRWLGNANAPMTPANQDLVAERQIQSWLDQGFTAEQVALSWNHGSPERVKGVNKYGAAYDSGAYADKVLAQLEQSGVRTGSRSAIEMQQEIEKQGGSQTTPAPVAPAETTKPEESGLSVDIKQPERKPLTEEQQVEADNDWNDNFAGRIEELDTQLNDLRTRIKEAKGEEKAALESEKQSLETKSADIEQEFLDKYSTVEEAVEEEGFEQNPENRIGLLDEDTSYTPNMKRLIKEAQENGDTFPFSKMTKDEQDIVDQVFRSLLDSAPINTPKNFKPYKATVTTDTVDVKRLSDPEYFKEVYESTFAVGGDKGLYKIMTKELVPKGKEASGFLADLYNKSKESDSKEAVDTKEPTNSETKEEKTPEEVADKYWNEVIAPRIEKGEAVIIGADDLKDHFGKDYDDANHPTYSKAAFKLYERALKEVEGDVMLTGGGPASGKTELLVRWFEEEGFNGIIYDSNLSNLEGAKKQIEMAKSAGKEVDIYGVTPDLASARRFSVIRENVTGRGITDKTFARGHAGFPSVVGSLIEEKIVSEKDVFILDTRETKSVDEAKNMVRNGEFVKNPLAHVKKLGYKEDYVREKYSKDRFTEGNAKASSDTESKSESDQPVSGSSRDGGTDTTTEVISQETLSDQPIAPNLNAKEKVKKSTAFKKAKERFSEDPEALTKYEGQDAEYVALQIDDQMAKAFELLETEPELAKAIALGTERPPFDITQSAISIAVLQKAKEAKDYELMAQVERNHSLRQTRKGQEIVMERGRIDENSSEFFVRELLNRRKHLAQMKYKPIFGKTVSFAKMLGKRSGETTKKGLRKLKTDLEIKGEELDSFLTKLAC